MRLVNILLSIMLILPIVSTAQPNMDWFRMYDINQVEEFVDIYTVADGGYAICGTVSIDERQYPDGEQYFWLSRVDDHGNQVWQGSYGIDNAINRASSLIETEDGGFLVVGRNNVEGHHVAALLTDADGEQIWYRTFRPGCCRAVIELKSGEFVLAGGEYGVAGLVMCINSEGRVLWETEINPRVERSAHSYFYALRETQGGIVLAGTINNLVIGVQHILWIAKVNFEGDLLWQRQYGNIENHQYWYSMVSAQDEGFVLGGTVGGTRENNRFVTDFLLSKVDDDGEIQWNRRFHFDLGNRNSDFQVCYNLVKYDDEGYALVGTLQSSGGDEIPAFIQVNNNGEELWRQMYDFSAEVDFGGSNYFYGGVKGHDNSIIACGIVNYIPAIPPRNGFIMKLEPYLRAPLIMFYEPEDTVFTVLQGDTVDFLVRAYDAQGDELSYLWTVGDDTISRDTTATYCFEELGEYIVTCRVSDGEFTASINWRVTAVEFYIVDFRPDSTEMTIR
ncbi:MAG TPA: PKD domain-containing protein, partial [Bacteroidetes bacterium]|nr:PKD domain-containing protein [Bacteroidota bacterium]